MFHTTASSALKTLLTKNHTSNLPAAAAGGCATSAGSLQANQSQHTEWRPAEMMAVVLIGRWRVTIGEKNTCRKLQANGAAVIPPTSGLERGSPFVTNVVKKTFTGRDMVTMGMARIPSITEARRPRRRRWRCWRMPDAVEVDSTMVPAALVGR
jgi:hypothetical protein